MGKLLIALIALCIIVFAVFFVGDTVKTTSNNQSSAEQQLTQRVIAVEQTKQEAAQLRTEETTRTLNTLAMIFGPIILIAMATLIIIIADSKTTRNRIFEINEMARIERNRIREEQRLEIIQQQRLRMEHSQMYLLPNNRVVESDVWTMNGER